MPQPTDEQLLVLNSRSKVRIVKAVPGSGKTWLVAEAMRRELAEWTHRHQGVAALSFTNVAGKEIRSALGVDPSHPHFVGTIDAFVFRYIVRPFVSFFDSNINRPRLVPADLAELLSKNQQWYGDDLEIQIGARTQRANPFVINFIDEQHNQPIFSTQLVPYGPPVRLSPQISSAVIAKKTHIWRHSGRLSHSDAAFLATRILTNGAVGDSICGLIARRFPLLIVDELQDTGWFLGQVLMRLFSHPGCRAIGVGDPDQAIYEFNGARPELFAQFEQLDQAESFKIETTTRCPRAVCRVAELLSSSDRNMISPGDRDGRALFLIHEGRDDEIRELGRRLITTNPQSRIRIVTRKNSVVQKLRGELKPEYPPFHSRPLEMLHRAVNHLRLGSMKKALISADAALARPIFSTEASIHLDLAHIGIDLFEWRRAVVNLLTKAHLEIQGEDIHSWGCRMIDAMEIALKQPGWWERAAPGRRLPNKPPSRTRNIIRADYLVSRREELLPSALPIQTVHAVKGETHHTTILYVPKPKTLQSCPSQMWWSVTPGDQEERRIAFVAATRPTEKFILCAHDLTFQRLQREHPEFLQVFEVMPLAQFIPVSSPETAGQLSTFPNQSDLSMQTGI